MRRTAAGLAMAVWALAACGISPDAAPRDLPEDERRLLTQSSSGTEAEGERRIYLAAPGDERLLRSVPRDAVTRGDLLEILFRGPNDEEAEEQFSTFLPPDLMLMSTPRSQGSLLFVNVSEEILQLGGQTLSLALAQIVLTATELDGVDRVQITVDDVQVAWPTLNSESTTAPLSVYDFPGLAQSSQSAFPALPAGT